MEKMKSDDIEFPKPKTGHGKREHQKIKPYLVMDYLMRKSDEEHTVSATEIVAYLQELGIDAERRSIYSDIAEINIVMWMLYNESTIEEAEEVIEEDIDDEEKFVLFDKSKKGYYIKQRKYDVNDIRLLAECVYSARFIDEKRAKRLANVACSLVSEPQAEAIKHDAFLADRVKTVNTSVYYNVSTINDAMRKGSRDKPHVPEKISFKYLKYSINDVSKMVERRSGQRYIVSPFKLLINDANYYLLAFDDKSKAMRKYRVDRMKDVQLMGVPREGEHEFIELDLSTFTQRTFGMFSGENKGLTMRFVNSLLDTVVDRFGTKGVQYTKADSNHFYVSAHVDISEQFFGWLCGFGKRVKIVGPESVEKAFTEYLDKLREMY